MFGMWKYNFCTGYFSHRHKKGLDSTMNTGTTYYESWEHFLSEMKRFHNEARESEDECGRQGDDAGEDSRSRSSTQFC